jgi:hypothetical protein
MRPKNAVPSYLKHSATGQARVVISGKTYYLGPYGSAKSRAEYARLIAEWSGSHSTIAPAPSNATSRQEGLYISELVPAYIRYAESYYVKNGEQTSQVAVVRMAVRPVRQIYGHTLARDFGPVALETCRQKLIDQATEQPVENEAATTALAQHRQQARGRDPADVPVGSVQGDDPRVCGSRPGNPSGLA